MTRVTYVICLAFSLVPATGCQNYLRVQVELLDAGGIERVTEATLPDAVDKSLEALKSFKGLLQELEAALEKEGRGEQISDVAPRHTKEADEFIKEGEDLLNKLKGAMAEDVYPLSMRARAYAYVVADFCTRKGQKYRNVLVDGADSSEHRQAMSALLDRLCWESRLSAVGSKALSATVEAAGFGGFTGVAAHQIDASDARYAEVVKARPIGRPFTLVESAVTGDSTIMFVQESPTQLRAFSVDMDPTQLVHNIIYIADKALQAASRMVETGL